MSIEDAKACRNIANFILPQVRQVFEATAADVTASAAARYEAAVMLDACEEAEWRIKEIDRMVADLEKRLENGSRRG